MKKILKYGLGAVGIIVLGFVALVLFLLHVKEPAQRPAPTETVELTPARIERGRYLATNVALCVHCHTDHDFHADGWPFKGPEGAGMCFPESLDLGGKICPPNITPHPTAGVGAWTDGELMRAIREGVSRDGRGLFPMMAYPEYSKMSDEDVRSIVAWIRSLPPSDRALPRTELVFPASLGAKIMPEPLTAAVADPAHDPLARGQYLANIALCGFCHNPDTGAPYSGGLPFIGMSGPEVSANITPDEETGIGKLDEATFISIFRSRSKAPADPTGKVRGIMPWHSFAGMKDDDLKAIYAYLRTVQPAKNPIPEKFPAKL